MSNINNINASLNDINWLIEKINRSGDLSLLEKDLLLEKLRIIYSEVSNIKISETKEKETVIREAEPKVKEEFSVKETEIKPVEIIKETKTDALKKNQETETEKDEHKTLGDKYQGSKKFIDEQLSKQYGSEGITSKMQNKPIPDLAKAIGLNEKFLFINELFDGDSSKFKDTINMLNNAADFNEAYSYITGNFSWNMKSETVQKILELVRRKFITPNK